MKKNIVFFILIFLAFSLNVSPAEFKPSYICLFDEDSSSLPMEDISKFLKLSGFSGGTTAQALNSRIEGADYLVLSKGNLAPQERQIVFEFLKGGGGLIVFLPKVYDIDFFNKIGVKSYQIYPGSFYPVLNKDLFKSEAGPAFSPQRGILVKTSYGGKIKQPGRGNVFPERIPVRDSTPLIKIKDSKGNYIASAAVMLKHWLNPWDLSGLPPLKWFIFSAKSIDFDKEFYSVISSLISNQALVKGLNFTYPLYYPDEEPAFSLELFNPDKEKRVKFLIEFYQDGKTVSSIYQDRIIKEGLNSFELNLQKKFSPGLYSVKCSLLGATNNVYDICDSAFLVSERGLSDNSIRLDVKGGDFLINGNKEFLWGVNYYESTRGELNWLWPDIYRINKDFELMQSLGFKMVRIHYHHPKWFKDYLVQAGSPLVDYFPDKNYLPGEYDLRVLDSFVYLARSSGLIICLDLFTLVPEEMGDPRGWLSLTDRITDQVKISRQLEFIRIIANRYKDISNISWDLWNEPRVPEEHKENLKIWAQDIISEFRANEDNHLITLGCDDSLSLADILDYLCVHTDSVKRENVLTLKLLELPVLLQEFWLAEDLSREEQQADELKNVISQLKKSTFKGFMPWQWTSQSRLWPHSEPEKWDNDLGLFLREDGTFKPAAFVLLNYR
ncbi:MAG: cellulase family glycosylhydrolase [Candidatus Omnitrophica bacterium]|nr:cellulase family glycosylhydrolase [Candidatus Omnitrophota bacterium]